MDSSRKEIKRDGDFVKGRENRERRLGDINKLLAIRHMRLEHIHKHVRKMSLPEKADKNKPPNRTSGVGEDEAMGLDCKLINSQSDRQVFIILRWFSDSQVFYKLPGKKGPEYMDDIANYWFLYTNDPAKELKFYFLKKNSSWKDDGNYWRLSDSEGNENRVVLYNQFHHPVSPGNLPYIDVKTGNSRVIDDSLQSIEIPLAEALRRIL